MEYLHNFIDLFNYYKSLGDKAINQVIDDEKLNWNPSIESNSIATIVKHLNGNMLSRWTDFLTTDGEKDFRNRDEEFLNDIDNRKDILAVWEQGWKVLFDALHNLSESDLSRIIYIRNEGHTVIQAINRQLAHYSYHIGQIVYLARLISGKEWQSLSIPKGYSIKYNSAKFAKEKRIQNFTKEI